MVGGQASSGGVNCFLLAVLFPGCKYHPRDYSRCSRYHAFAARVKSDILHVVS